MALIKRSDLKYEKDYSWTAVKGDDPKVTGEPDSTLFNRTEGYEVLYLINKLAGKWDFKTLSQGLKMEEMIKKHLPSDKRSQSNVAAWIKDNWAKY